MNDLETMLQRIAQAQHDITSRGFITLGQVIQLRAATDRIATLWAKRGCDSMTLIDVTDYVQAPE